MDNNLFSADSTVAIKQEVLQKIEEILSKENKNSTGTLNDGTKALFERKLKRASNRYKIMRPLTVGMGAIFTGMCLAQIFEINFFFSLFDWQKGALFFLLTLSLIVNVYTLKQQIERYKLLLYLLNLAERIAK